MAQTAQGAVKIAAQKAGLPVSEYSRRLAAGLKKCTRCKTWQPRTLFQGDRSRFDSLSATGRCCRLVKVRKSQKGRPSPFKGKKHAAETRRLISMKVKAAGSVWIGRKHRIETKAKISKYVREHCARGPACYNFSHGRAQRALNDRRKPEYFIWRKAVFERDAYICQKCAASKGANLRAHHVEPFASHPELRFEVSNGLTLCHPCHELEHYKPDSIRNIRKLKRGGRLWK